MCRLLGVVAHGTRPLPEIVPDELPLFTALSERHKDGWGVASYPSGTGTDGADEPAPLRPRVRRGTDTARASGAYGDAGADAPGERGSRADPGEHPSLRRGRGDLQPQRPVRPLRPAAHTDPRPGRARPRRHHGLRTVPLARHRVGGAAPPAGRPGRLGARDPA